MTYSTNNEAKISSSSNYVSVHQLLATDASFIEEASHSAVQECAEDRTVAREERKNDRMMHLGQKSASTGKSGKAASTAKAGRGAKTAPSQAKGFSGSDVLVTSKSASAPYSLQTKMELPVPAAANKGNNVWTDGDLSIVAVLNEVLVACAQAGSEFWKDMWSQATQNMMQALSLAKPIADAVQNQANAQADATQAEADMNKSDGMVNIGFSAVSFLMGMKESFFGKEEDPANFGTSKVDPEADATANADDAATEGEDTAQSQATAARASESSAATGQTQPSGASAGSAGKSAAPNDPNATPAGASDSGAPSASAEARSTTANASAGTNAQNDAARDAAQNDAQRANGKPDRLNVGGTAADKPNKYVQGAKAMFNRSTNFSSKVYKGFIKGFQVAQGMQMMATGICGVAYDAPGRGKMATYQRTAGQYDAMSKEGEMIAQFHNQAFSRGEDIRQGAQQQQIDTPLNVLKTAADTVTQAIMAQHV